MDCELLKILIQSSLTILGWFILVFWGLKQINIASSKNLALQRTLVRESHERGLAIEVINIYKGLMVSLDKLQQAGNHFISNFSLETDDENKIINYSAKNLIEPLNKRYHEACMDIHKLEMWLKISSPILPNAEVIQKALNYFFNDFTSTKQNKGKCPWVDFQMFLNVYQSDNKLKNNKGLFDSWKKLSTSLMDIEKKLTMAVAEVNGELIKTYNK